MKIKLDLGDITELEVEAIVNAANSSLLGGGGVDGAIHAAAGIELLKECASLGGCKVGEAKITGGYQLKARYVIHTVGPKYFFDPDPPSLLASCYRKCLDLALDYDLHSIAFPAISTGVYGYPKQEAGKIAVQSIRDWDKQHSSYEIDIILSCFDQETYAIYQELLGAELE